MSSLVNLIVKRNGFTLKNVINVRTVRHHFKCNFVTNSNRNVITHTIQSNTFISTQPSNLFKLLNTNALVQCRSIQTTNPNRIPPIFWVVLRPVVTVIAALTGRKTRNWWRNLSDDQKAHYLRLFKRNRKLFLAAFGSFLLGCTVYYVSHIEESPITKLLINRQRKRFMAFSKKKFDELSDLQFEAQLRMLNDKLLPNWHQRSKQVQRVATRIIRSNLDIPQIKDKVWTTAVIDAPEIRNAMVVGNGKIFVFSGMLDMCDNDDSLGFILAHEISHSILSHGIEMLSLSSFLDIFTTLAFFLLWSIMPTDLLAIISSMITKKLIEVIFNLPFTREMEIEADRVGMMLAAKSCIDVREGVAFWLKMSHIEKMKLKKMGLDQDDVIEFLSTHPSHEKRAECLEELLKDALKLRNECNCHILPFRDPIEIAHRMIARNERMIPSSRSRRCEVFTQYDGVMSFTSGLAMATLTQCFGHISGGHVSPSVSISLLATRKISFLRATFYIIAQCGGAIAGSALLYGVSVPAHNGALGVNLPHETLSTWQILSVEFVLSFLIVFTVFATMDPSRKAMGSDSLSIGIAYLVASLAGLPSSGASLNPARALGPSFVMGLRWRILWIYWVGPCLGGILAALIYEFIFDTKKMSRSVREAFEQIERDSQKDHYDEPTELKLNNNKSILAYSNSQHSSASSSGSQHTGYSSVQSTNTAFNPSGMVNSNLSNTFQHTVLTHDPSLYPQATSSANHLANNLSTNLNNLTSGQFSLNNSHNTPGIYSTTSRLNNNLRTLAYGNNLKY